MTFLPRLLLSAGRGGRHSTQPSQVSPPSCGWLTWLPSCGYSPTSFLTYRQGLGHPVGSRHTSVKGVCLFFCSPQLLGEFTSNSFFFLRTGILSTGDSHHGFCKKFSQILWAGNLFPAVRFYQPVKFYPSIEVLTGSHRLTAG